MKTYLLLLLFICSFLKAHCWGFYGHQRINYYAVFLLPPEMMILYKPHIRFLTEHSVDPDKRRYLVAEEGPRHYIDMDRYGRFPFSDIPRRWDSAVAKFGTDSLLRHGIVPWHISKMLSRLTRSFRERNFSLIMKYSAELGHYIADAHVPLHTSSNHNGQLTGQEGIHGFWESRIPELLAEKEFDFFIGKAAYIKDPESFIWERVMESAAATDSVLYIEQVLTSSTPSDKKFSFEERNGKLVKQYATNFTIQYDRKLGGMVERRMRQAIFSVASLWLTAWVNAGQPDLSEMAGTSFSESDRATFDSLNSGWHKREIMIGRAEDP
jgi:hypothetical protein